MPHTLGCDFQKGKRGSLKKKAIIENDHFYISLIMDGDLNDTILYFEFTRYFVNCKGNKGITNCYKCYSKSIILNRFELPLRLCRSFYWIQTHHLFLSMFKKDILKLTRRKNRLALSQNMYALCILYLWLCELAYWLLNRAASVENS